MLHLSWECGYFIPILKCPVGTPLLSTFHLQLSTKFPICLPVTFRQKPFLFYHICPASATLLRIWEAVEKKWTWGLLFPCSPCIIALVSRVVFPVWRVHYRKNAPCQIIKLNRHRQRIWPRAFFGSWNTQTVRLSKMLHTPPFLLNFPQ